MSSSLLFLTDNCLNILQRRSLSVFTDNCLNILQRRKLSVTSTISRNIKNPEKKRLTAGELEKQYHIAKKYFTLDDKIALYSLIRAHEAEQDHLKELVRIKYKDDLE